MKQPFNTKISVFKNLFESKDTPFELTLTEIYNRIRIGNPLLIDKIEKIRSAKTKTEKDSAKNSLIAILFNGTFQNRSDSGLIEHSGLCVLDFDKYPDKKTMDKEREELKKDKHVVLLFTSPSGNGLKAVYRIPKSDEITHKRRFKAIQKHINSDYFDEKNINVSRVCFESYDPEIYLNQYAEEFKGIEQEQGYSYIEKEPVCILEDEQKKIDLIMNFDWSKDFSDGQRNSYIFDIAGAFCEYGISRTTAESYIVNNVLVGDFSEIEALTTIRSAYKKRKFDTKYFEDYEKVKKVQAKIKSGYDNEKIKRELNVDDDVIDDVKEQLIDKDAPFWDVKTDKKGNKTITIQPFKYASFLVANGFNKYYPESTENPTFVRIQSNKVRLSSVSIIKDFVLTWLISQGEVDVWNYCSKSPYLFSESHLNMIDSIHLKMIADTRESSFIPFQNGVVEVTKTEVKLLSYVDIQGYIWENQIIQRDFETVTDYKNDFQDFVSKVCNSSQERINSLESTLGYLSHTYKDKTDQKSIIFNDQEIDDNPNGGSGKSLMLTALNHFRKVVKIDGKAFDPKKSDFVYQRVNLDTQILAFDDVRKNFNFEQLFSLITEGITVNRKNKDEIFIPFERSPKIVITTNYDINGAGASHDRRRHEIEFYQYFNNKRSPLKEYGRLLFDSWNSVDWNKFDNYMIRNIQDFLNNGLIQTASINADTKRFIQSTTKDFFDWTEEGNLSTGIRIYNAEIIPQFTQEYKNYKDLNTKTFIKWIAEYCQFKGFELVKSKDHKGRYFEIISGQEQKTEEEPPF